MKNILLKTAIAATAMLSLASVAHAQASNSLWKVLGGILQPVLNTYQLEIQQLGGHGTRCTQVDNNGLFSVAASACGSGGGGGSPSVGPVNVLQASDGAGAFIATGTPQLTVGNILATSTTATSTLPRLSVGTAFNFLGDYITSVAIWFSTRFDANFALKTTDNLTQGATNKYDQTVVLTNGTGISNTGTYPNFTITNTLPDQTVALTAGTGIGITGTYPNFTISNSLSTTSWAYFLSQNQGAAYSTTSADYWKTQRDFFSTTSATYFLGQNQGLAFSTTSANAYINASSTIPHPAGGAIGNLIQWDGTKYVSVATSTLGLGGSGGGSVTSVNASGGTTGLSFSGGPITTSGTLTLAGTLATANGGTGLTATGASSTVLTTDGTNPKWNKLATSQLTNDSGFLTSAVTSIAQTYGSAQTGAITFATSTASTFNGLTVSNTITNSSGAFTFAPPTITGLLTAGGGGTAISNPTAAQVLLGSYAGGAWQQLATSSLGINFSDLRGLASLTSQVTGVLPIANGGTNASSFTTSGNAAYYTGSALATAPLTSAVTTPYASSTAISAPTICVGTDCRTAWPSSGGGVWPFTTTDTNFGVAVQSTTTPEWFKNGVFASTTSQFVNASTTQLTVSGPVYMQDPTCGSNTCIFQANTGTGNGRVTGIAEGLGFAGGGGNIVYSSASSELDGSANLIFANNIFTTVNASTTNFSTKYASSTAAYFGTLNLTNITGTQCLHSISGVVSGTGSDCGSGGTLAWMFQGANNSTSTPTGFTGGAYVGTTTGAYPLTVYSATGNQVALSAGAGTAQWVEGNNGGTFYMSTTTVAGNATTSPPAVQLNPTGSAGLAVATSTPDSTLDIFGTVRFEGLSATTSPSISGAIVGLGCDSGDLVGFTGLASTTVFITTPQAYPGDGLNWFSYALNSTTIRTKVCSDVTVTPAASAYNIRIIR